MHASCHASNYTITWGHILGRSLSMIASLSRDSAHKCQCELILRVCPAHNQRRFSQNVALVILLPKVITQECDPRCDKPIKCLSCIMLLKAVQQSYRTHISVAAKNAPWMMVSSNPALLCLDVTANSRLALATYTYLSTLHEIVIQGK